ncbi:27809_t:CDS:2 [Dentiscutata erythropus]|uniref:27809_t:CDS:1 n=1 Tax=Dentiscutata erythropus TaxID=1348616 RepID=A0A9N9GLZ7_9GLOM|nr:27809_t:CDS:2 [Dentiscutata erythropus]
MSAKLLSEQIKNSENQSSHAGFALRKNKKDGLLIVGHRGASASYPENSIMALKGAIADGADAIEFDIQKTLDGEIVVLHDSTLDRVTDSKGRVMDRNYYGDIEHLRSKKEPNCPIALFKKVVDLMLMEENSHIWAMIDIKLLNSPSIIVDIEKILRSRSDDLKIFSTRFILGIWHPKYLPYAKTYLPDIPIAYIGASLKIAREYFSCVDAYNLMYSSVAWNKEGRDFIEQAHQVGKPVFVWTVNTLDYAKECYNINVDAVMTDRPGYFVDFFNKNNPETFEMTRFSWWYPKWLLSLYRRALMWVAHVLGSYHLSKHGPLEKVNFES